jgi:hypothetical protein
MKPNLILDLNKIWRPGFLPLPANISATAPIDRDINKNQIFP